MYIFEVELLMMKHQMLFVFAIVGLCLGASSQLDAQQAFVAAGADASNANGTISFSVGEMAYIDTYDSGGSCLAGVQQTYPELPTQLAKLPLPTEFTLFPNPSASQCTLSFSNEITT
ncbi:MAG: hypothetical protein RLZZ543_1242, partial [Bacteroidota bacterium]